MTKLFTQNNTVLFYRIILLLLHNLHIAETSRNVFIHLVYGTSAACGTADHIPLPETPLSLVLAPLLSRGPSYPLVIPQYLLRIPLSMDKYYHLMSSVRKQFQVTPGFLQISPEHNWPNFSLQDPPLSTQDPAVSREAAS